MKRYILLLALCFTVATTSAQHPWEYNPQPADLSAGRVFRTEILPYNSRSDAENRNRAGAGYHIEFTPSAMIESEAMSLYSQEIEIPYAWTDGSIYLHLENIGAAYSLLVNDEPIATVEDPLTPADFHLTPAMRQGTNTFRLVVRPSNTPQINPTAATVRKRFSESYLYYQEKRSIRDFEIELMPDSLHRNGILNVRFVAQNGYNYEEQVEAGYDIYSPQGKLLDFNFRAIPIPGRSTDTIHFEPFIYHVYENCWKAEPKRLPPLYRVMLYMRRNGVYKEYLPLTLGFGKTELINGKIVRFDEELKLSKKSYNAAIDRKTTLAEIKSLKAQGINTLCPNYPQPAWFYDLCTEQGMYVIDCAAIDAPEKRFDRSTGGTPSNDPALVGEYLERVKAMYYRSRNFSCVIAYALGNPSGNGYNMYKAYEWLKGVEKSRPIIYEDAAGEWNSDL